MAPILQSLSARRRAAADRLRSGGAEIPPRLLIPAVLAGIGLIVGGWWLGGLTAGSQQATATIQRVTRQVVTISGRPSVRQRTVRTTITERRNGRRVVRTLTVVQPQQRFITTAGPTGTVTVTGPVTTTVTTVTTTTTTTVSGPTTTVTSTTTATT